MKIPYNFTYVWDLKKQKLISKRHNQTDKHRIKLTVTKGDGIVTVENKRRAVGGTGFQLWNK